MSRLELTKNLNSINVLLMISKNDAKYENILSTFHQLSNFVFQMQDLNLNYNYFYLDM